MRKAAGPETAAPALARVFVRRPTPRQARNPGEPLGLVPGVAGETTFSSAHFSRNHHNPCRILT
jgi:hypothetical protein